MIAVSDEHMQRIVKNKFTYIIAGLSILVVVIFSNLKSTRNQYLPSISSIECKDNYCFVWHNYYIQANSRHSKDYHIPEGRMLSVTRFDKYFCDSNMYQTYSLTLFDTKFNSSLYSWDHSSPYISPNKNFIDPDSETGIIKDYLCQGISKENINQLLFLIYTKPKSKELRLFSEELKSKHNVKQAAAAPLSKNNNLSTKASIPQTLPNTQSKDLESDHQATENYINREINPDTVSYMSQVQKKIKRNWKPPRGKESHKMIVNFTVGENGSISNLILKKSSNDGESDNAALNAIVKAAPFPPLPTDTAPAINIEFTFDYNVFKR